MSALSSAPVQVQLPMLALNGIGEYTARSVVSDPLDASALHLVRQADGNYAPLVRSPVAVSDIPAAHAGVAVHVILQGFALGG